MLKAEVDTVGDFLLDQEQKALKTGIENDETWIRFLFKEYAFTLKISLMIYLFISM